MNTDEIHFINCLELLVTKLVISSSSNYVVVFSDNDELKKFKKSLLDRYLQVPSYLRPSVVKNTIKEMRTSTGVTITLVIANNQLIRNVKGMTVSCFFTSPRVNEDYTKELIELSKCRPFHCSVIKFVD